MDAPISPYPAMIRLGSAVTRKTKEGVVIGANQCIDAEDAIKAYTYGGAISLLRRRKKDHYCPVSLHDMVLLDADLTTINPDDIMNIKVNTTIVGGKIVYQSAHKK